MYALGDVPLILQGAGQRERLTPEQQARVASMGGSVAPARAAAVSSGIPPILLYAGIGLAAAWLLASGRGGGKMWG